MGADSNWNTAANWTNAQVPSAIDTVLFDSVSTKPCKLNVSPTISKITFVAKYTGTFNFLSDTLRVSGDADFRTGGAITVGTGALQFTGIAAQIFYPKALLTFPTIIQNGAGGTTISSANLTAGNLILTSGTLNLGLALKHTVANISGTGSINFSSSTLQTTGDSANFSSVSSVTAGTGALSFTSGSAQTFIPKSGATFPGIIQNGAGGTVIVTNALKAGALTIDQGTLDLGSSLVHTVTNVTNGAPNTGTINFNTSTLQTTGTVDFRQIAFISGTGTLAFTNAGAQIFYPHAGQLFPTIVRNGSSGTTTVTGNGLHCLNLTITLGDFNLGTGLSDTVDDLVFGAGSLSFTTDTLIAGDTVNFGSLATLNGATGVLIFQSGGPQMLVPKSVATHPAIIHHGAGTLQLSTNDLSTTSFTQDAGVLDFNGRNISTVGGGSFAITNGTTTTFIGLGGRTITVAGTASFNGVYGNNLNMNPGSAWTIASTGALTANYATIANSNASVSSGTAINSVNGGGNIHWNFPGPKTWIGGKGQQ